MWCFVEKRRFFDSLRIIEFFSIFLKDSNFLYLGYSGVNRRIFVLFGKKNFRSSKNDSFVLSSLGIFI